MALITKKEIDECRKSIAERKCSRCVWCNDIGTGLKSPCFATWVYAGNGKEKAGTYVGNHTVVDF